MRQPDGRFLFRDLGSLNGSFLRGERVNEHILHENDEIMLGSTCLAFQEQSAQESVLQKVTIAPSAGDALIRQRSRRRRRRANSFPSARSATSRCYAATTRSSGSRTSSADRSASR